MPTHVVYSVQLQLAAHWIEALRFFSSQNAKHLWPPLPPIPVPKAKHLVKVRAIAHLRLKSIVHSLYRNMPRFTSGCYGKWICKPSKMSRNNICQHSRSPLSANIHQSSKKDHLGYHRSPSTGIQRAGEYFSWQFPSYSLQYRNSTTHLYRSSDKGVFASWGFPGKVQLFRGEQCYTCERFFYLYFMRALFFLDGCSEYAS